MRSYKLVLLLKSELKKADSEKLLDDVRKWIGVIAKEKVTDIGEKKLAYPIKKEKKGNYLLVEFDTEKLIDGFNKRLMLADSILRHLLIRIK